MAIGGSAACATFSTHPPPRHRPGAWYGPATCVRGGGRGGRRTVRRPPPGPPDPGRRTDVCRFRCSGFGHTVRGWLDMPCPATQDKTRARPIPRSETKIRHMRVTCRMRYAVSNRTWNQTGGGGGGRPAGRFERMGGPGHLARTGGGDLCRHPAVKKAAGPVRPDAWRCLQDPRCRPSRPHATRRGGIRILAHACGMSGRDP